MVHVSIMPTFVRRTPTFGTGGGSLPDLPSVGPGGAFIRKLGNGAGCFNWTTWAGARLTPFSREARKSKGERIWSGFNVLYFVLSTLIS